MSLLLFAGFDPCAESFKGLADLIEKENGQNGQWNQGLAGSLSQEQQHVFAGHLSQHLPSSLGLLQSSQHSLPPGFSLSHIQQQQLHQHLFRPGKHDDWFGSVSTGDFIKLANINLTLIQMGLNKILRSRVLWFGCILYWIVIILKLFSKYYRNVRIQMEKQF